MDDFQETKHTVNKDINKYIILYLAFLLFKFLDIATIFGIYYFSAKQNRAGTFFWGEILKYLTNSGRKLETRSCSYKVFEKTNEEGTHRPGTQIDVEHCINTRSR